MGYVGKVRASSADHLVVSTGYGTCSTAASTAAKVVSLTDYDALMTGSTIHVKFVYSNTANSPTLNVNGTGAKPIYIYGTTYAGKTEATSWPANSVVSFTYDGTAWRINDAETQKLINNDVWVNNVGDAMTGDLTLEDSNVNFKSASITDGTTPDANTYGRGVFLKDANNVAIGAVRPFAGATGTIEGIQGALIAALRTVSESTVENYVRLGIDASGNCVVLIPNGAVAAWRAALGLGTSGAFPITIAQGGTGATSKAAGQANLGFYTSVEQLSLTSSATMANVANAMPDGSVAVLNTATFDATTGMTAPDSKEVSIVAISKNGTYRTFAIGARSYNGVNLGNTLLYYAAWDGAAFVGWRKVFLSDSAALAVADGGTGQTGTASESTVSNIISAASGFVITAATYKQWGNVAQINVEAKKTAAVTTAADITIGTVVSGKRPSAACGAICTSSTISHSYLTTSGTLVANGTWAANVSKTISATYIL